MKKSVCENIFKLIPGIQKPLHSGDFYILDFLQKLLNNYEECNMWNHIVQILILLRKEILKW